MTLSLLAAIVVAAAPPPSVEKAQPPPVEKAQPPSVEKTSASAAEKGPREPTAQLEIPLLDVAFEATPVAKVGDELITLREVASALEATHKDPGMAMGMMSAGQAGMGGKIDIRAILDRLIVVKLVVAEAREMGLDELDEVKKNFADFRVSALREVVRRRAFTGATVDPAKVDEAYKNAIKEWKLRSVLFAADKEAEATALVAAAKAGGNFKDLADKAVADKTATGGESAFVDRDVLAPAIMEAIWPLKVGEVAGPVTVKEGLTVLALEEVRFPDKPDVRTQVENQLLAARQRELVKKHTDELTAKYAKLDRKLLKSLDYHSEKRFKAYAKDMRPLVTIKGEKPITVADLTKEISADYFHGAESPIRMKRVNRDIQPKLEMLLGRRLHLKEAKGLGIEESDEYLQIYREYTDSILFGIFVQRVVAPEIQVMESETRARYDADIAQYTVPAMYRLDALTFGSAKGAQRALDQLQKGSDLGWVRANAEDQIPAEKCSLKIGNVPFTLKGMPPALAEALRGAKQGDLRMFEASKGEVYVIQVAEEIPESHDPYTEVRGKIAQKLFGERLDTAVKDYAAKLREATPIRIFLAEISS